MRRRNFIVCVGGALATYAAPGAVRAQSRKMLRLGMASILPQNTPFMDAFVKRLRELGYEEGKNLAVDYVKVFSPAEYPAAMEEVLRRNVDIIVAQGPDTTLQSAMAATKNLPIVMIAIDYDPFARGYVTSLAHPTGNVTGVFFQQIELSAKRLEIAKQLIPGLQSAAVFWDSGSADQFQSLKTSGENLGIRLFDVELRDPPYNYESAWERVPADFRTMLILPTSGVLFRDRQRIASVTVEHRIPAMFAFRDWVDAGGLVSYGASLTGLFARAAEYVQKLAKGASPADLPIEQPTTFELVLNLRTAKEIGLTIPQAILLRADEVIE
ncbi:MAG: ABC transporter substrate-binding protein [Hyphomicrobiales bacterium]|nr:ABC transporter substrate-binding protein [Hyphomicrobiales bacterium]